MYGYIYSGIAALVLILLAVFVARKKNVNEPVKALTVAGFIAVAVAIVAISGIMIWIDYSGWTVIEAV